MKSLAKLNKRQMKEQEIKYKIAKAIAERQLTKQGINDATDTVYKIFEEQLALCTVSDSFISVGEKRLIKRKANK